MNLKIQFEARSGSPKHVVVMDSKSVAISVPAKKILQIVSIIPKIEFGKEIHLTCKCDGLACHKGQFYVYTKCMDETSCF